MIDIIDLRSEDVVLTTKKSKETSPEKYYKIYSAVRYDVLPEKSVRILETNSKIMKISDVTPNELVPVKITEDLLIKLGFTERMVEQTKSHRYISYNILTDKGHVSVSNFPNEYYDTTENKFKAIVYNEKSQIIGTLYVEYLHELQHIILDCHHKDLDISMLCEI